MQVDGINSSARSTQSFLPDQAPTADASRFSQELGGGPQGQGGPQSQFGPQGQGCLHGAGAPQGQFGLPGQGGPHGAGAPQSQFGSHGQQGGPQGQNGPHGAGGPQGQGGPHGAGGPHGQGGFQGADQPDQSDLSGSQDIMNLINQLFTALQSGQVNSSANSLGGSFGLEDLFSQVQEASSGSFNY